jgi:hypothetical protein
MDVSPPDPPPLFHVVANPELSESTRKHAHPGDIPECNLCGHARTSEEAHENENSVKEAALQYATYVQKKTCAEAEGWIKMVFGNRDLVYCAQCCQFSGECCSLKLSKLSTKRHIWSLVVVSVVYKGELFEGSPWVPPENLTAFYEGVLAGDLVLNVKCACDGASCDPTFRACCRTTTCATHSRSTRGTIPQACGCELETDMEAVKREVLSRREDEDNVSVADAAHALWAAMFKRKSAPQRRKSLVVKT